MTGNRFSLDTRKKGRNLRAQESSRSSRKSGPRFQASDLPHPKPSQVGLPYFEVPDRPSENRELDCCSELGSQTAPKKTELKNESFAGSSGPNL